MDMLQISNLSVSKSSARAWSSSPSPQCQVACWLQESKNRLESISPALNTCKEHKYFCSAVYLETVYKLWGLTSLNFAVCVWSTAVLTRRSAFTVGNGIIILTFCSRLDSVPIFTGNCLSYPDVGQQPCVRLHSRGPRHPLAAAELAGFSPWGVGCWHVLLHFRIRAFAENFKTSQNSER